MRAGFDGIVVSGGPGEPGVWLLELGGAVAIRAVRVHEGAFSGGGSWPMSCRKTKPSPAREAADVLPLHAGQGEGASALPTSSSLIEGFDGSGIACVAGRLGRLPPANLCRPDTTLAKWEEADRCIRDLGSPVCRSHGERGGRTTVQPSQYADFPPCTLYGAALRTDCAGRRAVAEGGQHSPSRGRLPGGSGSCCWA